MLINAAIDEVRRLGLKHRLLARRARRAHKRPLILVPPCLGTRLQSESGRTVWGSLRNIFLGTRLSTTETVKACGLLTGFHVVPGLYRVDIMGSFVRYLRKVGGYRLDEDLFILNHDWRVGVVRAARDLAQLIDRVRGISEEQVDVVAVSSGGTVLRYYMAYGDEDVLGMSHPKPTTTGADAIGRVVYMACPQRGSFSALAYLHEGLTFHDWGRPITALEMANWQTSYDFLPHPDDPVFIDKSGAPLSVDLYDAKRWHSLGIVSAQYPDLDNRLARAKALHRALDRTGGHRDVFALIAQHVPTRARALIINGRMQLPSCCYSADSPHTRTAWLVGDGAVPAHSTLAIPGILPERIWSVKPKAHHLIAAGAGIFPLVIEALLATDRPARRRRSLLVVPATQRVEAAG